MVFSFALNSAVLTFLNTKNAFGSFFLFNGIGLSTGVAVIGVVIVGVVVVVLLVVVVVATGDPGSVGDAGSARPGKTFFVCCKAHRISAALPSPTPLGNAFLSFEA